MDSSRPPDFAQSRVESTYMGCSTARIRSGHAQGVTERRESAIFRTGLRVCHLRGKGLRGFLNNSGSLSARAGACGRFVSTAILLAIGWSTGCGSFCKTTRISSRHLIAWLRNIAPNLYGRPNGFMQRFPCGLLWPLAVKGAVCAAASWAVLRVDLASCRDWCGILRQRRDL